MTCTTCRRRCGTTSDVRAHPLMTDMVHEHGALAGAELWFGGVRSANLGTAPDIDGCGRLSELASVTRSRSRAMDKAGHPRLAALAPATPPCALEMPASTSSMSMPRTTTCCRTSSTGAPTRARDEYGGSLENRTRLVRELIEETKEAVGDRCAVAVRFCGRRDDRARTACRSGASGREMFAMMAEMPDLWDINIADYSLEMGVPRAS